MLCTLSCQSTFLQFHSDFFKLLQIFDIRNLINGIFPLVSRVEVQVLPFFRKHPYTNESNLGSVKEEFHIKKPIEICFGGFLRTEVHTKQKVLITILHVKTS